MDFLTSKKLSLICAYTNAAMAIASLLTGQWAWSIFCLLLAAFCYNNYQIMDQNHWPVNSDVIAIITLIIAHTKLSLLDVKKFILSSPSYKHRSHKKQ